MPIPNTDTSSEQLCPHPLTEGYCGADLEGVHDLGRLAFLVVREEARQEDDTDKHETNAGQVIQGKDTVLGQSCCTPRQLSSKVVHVLEVDSVRGVLDVRAVEDEAQQGRHLW